jgi:hypothetical protein
MPDAGAKMSIRPLPIFFFEVSDGGVKVVFGFELISVEGFVFDGNGSICGVFAGYGRD